MATTRIMPLHIGKGRTESRAISDIIDYVANPQKTDNGKLITSYGCDSRTADAEFLLAKRQYIAATGRVRGADDVIAYLKWSDQKQHNTACKVCQHVLQRQTQSQTDRTKDGHNGCGTDAQFISCNKNCQATNGHVHRRL